MRSSINSEVSSTTRISSIAAALTVGGAGFRFGCQLVILLALLLGGIARDSLAAARFVTGLVPDWDQPYTYGPANGPSDPNPALVNQWDDWCVPTCAADLAGHWTDVRGLPVADGTPFPGSTVAWAVGASWHDYQADGTVNRPAPQIAAGPLPVPTTDIGWYLDTNRGTPYDAGGGTMGGFFFNNGNHNGTYLKDFHPGLQNFLNSRYGLSGSVVWRSGTQGIGFAAGVNAAGLAAQMHGNAASAFAEVMAEIDTNRTLILSFSYWNPVPTGQSIAQTGTNSESALGGTYYTWGAAPPPGVTQGEDWNFYDNDNALGHAVTCVGYILHGDADDKWNQVGLAGPTDWVIVHDNWSTTTRNVIIPFNFALGHGGSWVANTTVVPWPTGARVVNGLVPDWNQPYRYNPQSPNGGPGVVNPPPPPFGAARQWSAWCAPASAANLTGHWDDSHGAPVADGIAFSGSAVAWGAGSSWQDYLADGFARPAFETNAPASLPPSPTDLGWYLDTNRGTPYDPPGVGTMGGYYFGNPPHIGTYLKDIDVGLRNYLNSRYCPSGPGWDTGTAGRTFTNGCDSSGGPAQALTDPVGAFDQVKTEIDRNHTLLLSYKHWNLVAGQTAVLPSVGQSTEADYGGTYYVWDNTPIPANAEDEQWMPDESAMSLGHVVTAVGYIPAGDLLDPGPSLGGQGLGVPTDWVIVHDNWASTPRNVIIPYDWAVNWVANTIAFPDSGFLRITRLEVAAGTNAVISFHGIPGRLHHLEWKSEITNTTWATCVSNQAFRAGTMQITNAFESSIQRRFYRIASD
jgi:hypothetical protein